MLLKLQKERDFFFKAMTWTIWKPSEVKGFQGTSLFFLLLKNGHSTHVINAHFWVSKSAVLLANRTDRRKATSKEEIIKWSFKYHWHLTLESIFPCKTDFSSLSLHLAKYRRKLPLRGLRLVGGNIEASWWQRRPSRGWRIH